MSDEKKDNDSPKFVEFVEFGGMNCNDWLQDGEEPCPGWDVVNQPRRCACGNRRVTMTEIGPEAW